MGKLLLALAVMLTTVLTPSPAFAWGFAVRPVLEGRLSSAITVTASLIITAWEQAGKPVMLTETSRTPRPVRR